MRGRICLDSYSALMVVVMHGAAAALGNKRSPVPGDDSEDTRSRERLKEIPKKLSERGGGIVTSDHPPVHQGSVSAPASPQLGW